MNTDHRLLQIRVYETDGSVRIFTHQDPDLMNRCLSELHPDLLFSRDRIAITDGSSEATFLPPLVTRVDLVTDQLSVWDFPFLLGALMERTEAEFNDGVEALRGQTVGGGVTSAFLGLEMLNGQRICLWMQIIAGLQTRSLNRIYSLLKERRLIFGLREGGIGILNLANLLRLSIHPEPPEVEAVNGSRHHEIARPKLRLAVRHRAPTNRPALRLTVHKHPASDHLGD